VIDVATLEAKTALVVGLGSGGSAVALELAKAGIGRFILIDPDVIEEANLIRHECDARYLSWNKAEAVADLIRHRNPDALVTTVAEDVFDLGSRLERRVAAADLVAVCTDTEASKHLLNRLCTSSGTAAVYAGVYERGTGGEVIRCGGSAEDACYACVASALKEEVPIAEPDELDYGLLDEDGRLSAAPGLGLDVRLIALVHAKVCLGTLLDSNDIAGNVVLFGTAAVEGLFPRPFASATLRISPQDGCLVCKPLRTGGLPEPAV
jgi:molybdopterin/thiamine biosynthesis adenylyltransferase